MSIFSEIIKGNIPSYKIDENENYYAFLDINPMTKGHTLVVPKLEVNNMFDLDSQLLAKLFQFAQPIAKAIEQSFECDRCGMSVIGLEVPHAHLHLIPIQSADDLNFTRPKLNLSSEEMIECQKLILSQF